jgi:hypothetical protein
MLNTKLKLSILAEKSDKLLTVNGYGYYVHTYLNYPVWSFAN